MLPIAAPVVHGNRPAARMPPNFMTALGGRGEQSPRAYFTYFRTRPKVGARRGLSANWNKTLKSQKADLLGIKVSMAAKQLPKWKITLRELSYPVPPK
jgi:hypothetical protein